VICSPPQRCTPRNPGDHLSVRSAGPSHQSVLPYGAYGETRSKHLASVCVGVDRAALNSFYTSASSRYGVFNAVPTVQADDSDEARWRPGPGYTQQRRDPLRPAGSRRRQVEWLLRAALEQWRNIGLRAFDFNEDRDCAFVDGLTARACEFGSGPASWMSNSPLQTQSGPTEPTDRHESSVTRLRRSLPTAGMSTRTCWSVDARIVIRELSVPSTRCEPRNPGDTGIGARAAGQSKMTCGHDCSE
jgi:hypothetical protein